MNIIERPSPNFDSREGHAVDMLVLHYTDTLDLAEAFSYLLSVEKKVSAHYVIDDNGDIYRLVDEHMRACHAGLSSWRGETNINQRSIGIEIVNPGHTHGLRDYPPVQMKAVIALCKAILARHPIPARNVVAHSDIAPSRKKDPGERFDWPMLAAEGIGHWALGIREEKNPQSPIPNARSLAEYGYDTADLPKAIEAFQRRFRPQKIDGNWDDECAGLLAALIAMV